MRKKIIILICSLMVFMAGLLSFTFPDQGMFIRISKALELFGAIFREVTLNYVDYIDPIEFVGEGTKAMLESLDPYSEILDEGGEDDFELLTTNTYTGFGMVVGIIDGDLTIADLYDGYAAKRNGVRPGDRILLMDTVFVLHDTTNIIRKFTRGQVGEKVSMTILRGAKPDTLNVILTKESIRVQSLGYTGIIQDSIGYIAIERFSASTADEVKRAITSLRRTSGGLSGLILDLRGNPGGLLESAVDVCSIFLPQKSTIVITKGRTYNDEREYVSQYQPLEPLLPLAVLIDKESASASEVVAGALQDLDRAVILGEQSFGKGLVQTILDLPGQKSLKLTTARYYTPSGRCIQKLRTNNEGSISIDSLTEFFTKNGRPVKARHGIAPDTLIETAAQSSFIKMLIEEQYFFRFASEFCSTIDSVPNSWRAGEKEFKKFSNWLQKQESIPYPEPYGILDTSVQLAQINGFSQKFTQSLIAIKKQAIKDLQKTLGMSKTTVLAIITKNIQNRYRSAAELGAIYTEQDPLIRKGIPLIGYPAYSRLLKKQNLFRQ